MNNTCVFEEDIRHIQGVILMARNVNRKVIPMNNHKKKKPSKDDFKQNKPYQTKPPDDCA